MKARKDMFTQIIDKLIFYVSLTFIFLFPLMFLTVTTEFISYNKLVLTIVVSVILLVLWVIKAFSTNRFTISRTKLDIPFILLIIVLSAATYYSVSPFTSVFGAFNSWHFTLFEFLAFIVILYAMVTNVSGWNKIKALILSFFASSFFVAVINIISYFNLLDNVEFASDYSLLKVLQVNGFSPAGNTQSVILLMLAAMFIGLFALYYFYKEYKKNNTHKASFALRIVATLIVTTTIASSLMLWLLVFIPGVSSNNPKLSQLSFGSSWKIATATLSNHALWGVGPSVYASAYNAYKPIAINATQYWNTIFNQSGSEYLSWLTVTGVVGFVVLLIVVYKLLRMAFVSLREAHELRDNKKIASESSLVGYLLYPIVLSIIAILFAYLFTSSTVTITGVLFILLALWLLIEKHWRGDIAEDVVLDIRAVKKSFMRNPKESLTSPKGFSYMPIIIGVPVLLVGLVALFFTVQDFRSNLAYAASIKAINNKQSGGTIYDLQRKAIQLNPRRDAYRIGYANTNISLAEAIAAQNKDKIDDATRSNISALINQSVREVSVATEVINPSSATNWQARGNLYRRLIGSYNNAQNLALDAYSVAGRLAPTNPLVSINIGDLFYYLASNVDQIHAKEIKEAKDPKTQKQNLVQNYLAQAQVAYRTAVNLKPDLVNAHYGLANVYMLADSKDLAIGELKTILNLLPEKDKDNRKQVQDLITKLQGDNGKNDNGSKSNAEDANGKTTPLPTLPPEQPINPDAVTPAS